MALLPYRLAAAPSATSTREKSLPLMPAKFTPPVYPLLMGMPSIMTNVRLALALFGMPRREMDALVSIMPLLRVLNTPGMLLTASSRVLRLRDCI